MHLSVFFGSGDFIFPEYTSERRKINGTGWGKRDSKTRIGEEFQVEKEIF